MAGRRPRSQADPRHRSQDPVGPTECRVNVGQRGPHAEQGIVEGRRGARHVFDRVLKMQREALQGLADLSEIYLEQRLEIIVADLDAPVPGLHLAVRHELLCHGDRMSPCRNLVWQLTPFLIRNDLPACLQHEIVKRHDASLPSRFFFSLLLLASSSSKARSCSSKARASTQYTTTACLANYSAAALVPSRATMSSSRRIASRTTPRSFSNSWARRDHD